MPYTISKIIRYSIISGLLLFIVLLFTLDLVIDTNTQFVLSGYGILILSYFTLMIILSKLNNNKIHKIVSGDIDEQYLDLKNHKTSCIICGYRENPQFFIECLESIYINSHDLDKVILVIDGNEDTDKYMVSIFNQVFNENSRTIFLDNTIYDILLNLDNTQKQSYLQSLKINEKFICISQKHHGKRYAMYSGFIISLINNMDLSITIDSDTIFDDNTINMMKNCFKDKRIGGATGNLQIFNNNNIISYLSMLRYWSAFNLERAYGSYYGGVLCLSGPISCYRNSIFRNKELLISWLNQTFLGKECTFGDDRHLTNKILEAGYQTVYNPYAYAYTETPETINRFIKQQTRWTKSGYRELLWVLKFLHKHSILMTIDITYQMFYPLIIFVLITYTMWKMKFLSLITYLGLIFAVSFIRSVYAVLSTGKWEYILFYCYSLLYVSTIIPIKVYALFTLKDNTWGNIGRYKLNGNLTVEWALIIIWNLVLLLGIGLTFYKDTLNKTELGILCGLIAVYGSGYLMVYLRSKLGYNEIYKNIKKRNYEIDNREIDLDVREYFEDIGI